MQLPELSKNAQARIRAARLQGQVIVSRAKEVLGAAFNPNLVGGPDFSEGYSAVGVAHAQAAVVEFNAEASEYFALIRNEVTYREALEILAKAASKRHHDLGRESLRTCILEWQEKAVASREPASSNSRLSSSITSKVAAGKLRDYLERKSITKEGFAASAETSGKTIGKFIHTGKIRKSILPGIAKAMGISEEELLK